MKNKRDLKRHPKSKRKLTARPGKGTQKKEAPDEVRKKLKDKKKEVKPKVEFEPESWDNIASKLSNKSRSDIQSEIVKLETKMEKRNQAAIRREQRAQGNLDGTAIDAAYERNRPDEMRTKLLKHYLQNGSKPLPKNLKEEFEQYQKDQEWRQEHKEKRKERREQEMSEHGHLMDKMVTWTSKKNFGREMIGRVTAVKSGKRGPYVKTDTGWKVPVSMITKSKTAPIEERHKTRVQPKSLVGKKITWPTKHRPQIFRRPRRMRPGRLYRVGPKPAPPGYDATSGTASGVVTGVKGSKLLVDNWTVPITLVKKVDDKDFTGWV